MRNSEKFNRVTEFIDETVESGLVPGVSLNIVSPKEIEFEHYSGYAHYPKEIKVNKNTIYDLASLTKVISTAPSILYLLEKGLLDLDDPVYNYIPEYKINLSDITIKHLLTHTSGLQPEIKFHLEGYTLEESIEEISKIKDEKEPGTEVIYSDLNFISLGYIIEKVTGTSLNDFSSKHIFEPIGMKETFYNPAKELISSIAATEYREYLGDYQWGEVHDENAHCFGGISGHAGLFSTVHDVSTFCQMYLNKGKCNSLQLFSPQTIDLSIQNFTSKINLNRGLGWQLYDSPSIYGQYFYDGFGHTGFTGTSIWISPQNSVAIVLLTNRVHFGRSKNINRFRRIVHNLVAMAYE